jgi:hypothetical protein
MLEAVGMPSFVPLSETERGFGRGHLPREGAYVISEEDRCFPVVARSLVRPFFVILSEKVTIEIRMMPLPPLSRGWHAVPNKVLRPFRRLITRLSMTPQPPKDGHYWGTASSRSTDGVSGISNESVGSGESCEAGVECRLSRSKAWR